MRPAQRELPGRLHLRARRRGVHARLPILRGGDAPARDYFYWELHEQRPIQAVRFGHWKAVRNGHDRPIELYDLATDAGEARDLAATKPDLVARAEAIMKAAHQPDSNWPLTGRAAHRASGAGKKKAAKKQ